MLAPGVKNEFVWAGGKADEAVLGFGTENVNAACLRAIFSDCNRDSRSRKLTFSDSACWFLASRAATLSSS